MYCVVISPRSHGLPLVLGKTRSKAPFGHASFHSRNVFSTSGPSGTVRLPDLDFGLPISLYLSARWRTCSSPRFRSTSPQRRPRSSEARSPVKVAVIRNGRTRPVAACRILLISSGVGISTPTSSLRSPRLSLRILTGSATFCATLPRRCASLSNIFKLVRTFELDRAQCHANRTGLVRNLFGHQFPICWVGGIEHDCDRFDCRKCRAQNFHQLGHHVLCHVR